MFSLSSYANSIISVTMTTKVFSDSVLSQVQFESPTDRGKHNAV